MTSSLLYQTVHFYFKVEIYPLNLFSLESYYCFVSVTKYSNALSSIYMLAIMIMQYIWTVAACDSAVS